MNQSLLVAFFLGLLVRDVAKYAHGRFLMWKFERQYEAAKLRMVGCKHERTIEINLAPGLELPPLADGTTSDGLFTNKCLDCWAIQAFGTGTKWTPNSASPEVYKRRDGLGT